MFHRPVMNQADVSPPLTPASEIKEEPNDADASSLISLDLKQEQEDEPDYVDLSVFTSTKPKPEEKRFHCPQCPRKYHRSEYLALHLAVHSPKMTCHVCGAKFTDRTKLKKHMNAYIKHKMEEARNEQLTCTYCSKWFKTPKQLRLHVRVHTNERPYKCQICGEGFKQLNALGNHQVTHTKEKRYTCEICNGAYTTSSSLRRHQRRIHERGRAMKCGYCKGMFYNRADFTTHQEQEHNDVKFKRNCPGCFEIFYTRTAFKQHKEENGEHFPVVERGVKTYTCPLCGKEISGMKSYMDHRREHLSYSNEDLKQAYKSSSFPCKFCPAVYKLRQSLFVHMDEHMDKTVHCDLCDKDTTHYGLKVHKRRVHSHITCKHCREVVLGRRALFLHYRKHHAKSKSYQCHVCGKKFLLKESLVRHFRREHNVSTSFKPFKCGSCSKRFFTHLHLAAHKRKWHSSKTDYKCPVCDTSFHTLKEIKEHNLTHDRASFRRCWRCRICKKIFKLRGNYLHHLSLKNCIQFLSKRTLHQCQVCGKELHSEDTWRRHYQLHSSFEYHCPYCEKKYKQVESMRKHMSRRHSGKQLFWCDTCGKGFEQEGEFETHYAGHDVKVEEEMVVKMEPFEGEVKEEVVD
ncbi:hypothetical protein NQ315_001530 [Exocentrus adspersus]|uniref:C2H2-type domain-containing protein n=1 Tax=Exocentrus adspersus TaxID=1586481 RepID=A0AAV8W8K2_9CUCU|nr:hypothetical protein NQ315_001530 [Exocentrus adspersus]